MPADTLVAEPAGDVLAVPDRDLAATTIGRSRARRIAGLTGQYALLVAIAFVVLAPVAFSVVMALSPPFDYIAAGRPLHPVNIDWKGRSWLDGGALSVVLRTAIVVLALAWVQLKVAGGTVRSLGLLLAPRRLVAVVAGTVVVAVLAGRVWVASLDGSTSTPLWWLAAVGAVAATQLIGFGEHRPLWRPVVLALVTGLVAVVVTVIAFGAAIWNSAWNAGNIGDAMTRSVVITVLITSAQVVTAILAAYAFAFLRFPLKTLFFAFFMGTLLLPLEVTLLANVQTIRELGWVNSNAGLVLPFAATAFGTFLIRQGFKGVPPEIQDATRLDGYGHMGVPVEVRGAADPPGDRVVHRHRGAGGVEPVPVAPGRHRRQPPADRPDRPAHDHRDQRPGVQPRRRRRADRGAAGGGVARRVPAPDHPGPDRRRGQGLRGPTCRTAPCPPSQRWGCWP